MMETAPSTARLWHYKLVLLGDSAVGKSSFVTRFVKKEFSDNSLPTIGAAFFTKSIKVNDGAAKFEIWDTAGQERYRSLAPMYYRGAYSALVVFDLTDTSSFEGARTWIEELKKQASREMLIVLIGNKADLAHLRKIKREQGEHLAKEYSCYYFETSAKTGDSIDDVFKFIAEKLPRTLEDEDNSLRSFEKSSFKERSCCW